MNIETQDFICKTLSGKTISTVRANLLLNEENYNAAIEIYYPIHGYGMNDTEAVKDLEDKIARWDAGWARVGEALKKFGDEPVDG